MRRGEVVHACVCVCVCVCGGGGGLSLDKRTSWRTPSMRSECLLKMCFRTKSGPRNFFPLNGQRNLSFPTSLQLSATNLSISASYSRLPIWLISLSLNSFFALRNMDSFCSRDLRCSRTETNKKRRGKWVRRHKK